MNQLNNSTDMNVSSNNDNKKSIESNTKSLLNLIETMNIESSVSVTTTPKNSKFKRFSSLRATGRTISTVKSRIAFFSNPINSTQPVDNRGHKASEQNKMATTSTDVNNKSPESSIISEKNIVNIEHKYLTDKKMLNTETRNKSKVNIPSSSKTNESNVYKYSPKSIEYNNSREIVKQLKVNYLNESNIWPLLISLETNVINNNENCEKDDSEILKKLNKIFNQSPKLFIEHLLTTIEKTFIDEDSFLKKPDDKENLNENQTSTKIEYPKTNEQSMDAMNTSFFQNSESIDKSTRQQNKQVNTSIQQGLKNFVKSLFIIPNKKNYQQRPKLLSNRETSNETVIRHRSRERNNATNSVAAAFAAGVNKKSSKIPMIVGKRENPKLAMTHRLRIGSSNSTVKNPREFSKTKPPEIIIHLASPQVSSNSAGRFLTPRKKSDDEEYFTAESDSEDESQQSTHQAEESIVSSSQRFHMSRAVAMTHKQVSTLKSRDSWSRAARRRRLSSASNNLEEIWRKELHQKRQNCINVIDKFLSKDVNAVQSEAMKSADSCIESKPSIEFLDTLQACSDYLAYWANVKKIYYSMANSGKLLTTLSVNLASDRKNPHSSSRCTPKKSPTLPTKRTFRPKTPSKICLNTSLRASPMLLKRRSLHKGTPVIDRSAMRSVTELRKIFSPRLRAVAGSPKSTERENCATKTVKKISHLKKPENSSDSKTKVATPKTKKI